MTMICTNDVSIRHFIDSILGLSEKGYVSTLMQMMKEAASLADFVPGYLGLIGHLTCIEQFGNIFEPKIPARTTQKGNPFKRCLVFFTSMPEAEIEALYGLRNGLVHDQSICNINLNLDKSSPAHAYLFRPQWNGPNGVVTLPKRDWKGDFKIFDADRQIELEESTTYINVTELAELIRAIHAKVVELHSAAKLNCKIKTQPAIYELMARYALLIRGKN